MSMTSPQSLDKILEKITRTGKTELDPTLLKEIKKECKRDATLIPILKDSLMKRLSDDHCEVRLSAFQLLIEIFERSDRFRELVVEDLKALLELVLEIEPGRRKLPLPEKAKRSLKRLASTKVEEWSSSFGDSHPKLRHAYNFLRQVKRVEFDGGSADSPRSRAAIQREEARKQRKERIWKMRTSKVREEMEEHLKPGGSIDECLVQLENCLELVLPPPEKFLHHDGGGDDDDGDDDACVEREHGMVDARRVIQVDLTTLNVRDESSAVSENLRDQLAILTNRLIPLAKKWVVTLTKAGNDDARELLKKAIDAKVKLEVAETKVEALGVDVNQTRKVAVEESDDDGDDDFEDVPDKVAYQESAEKDGFLELVFLRSEKDVAVTTSTSCRSDGAEKSSNTIKLWSCRAPLPSGRLCPRKDRRRCPLHGVVVARDPVTGLPDDPNHKELETKSANDDVEFLRDVEAATGQRLTSTGKGKGRGKRSGLTDLKVRDDTARKRLEKKVFNRSSLKRVADSLDKSDSKRSRRKFSLAMLLLVG